MSFSIQVSIGLEALRMEVNIVQWSGRTQANPPKSFFTIYSTREGTFFRHQSNNRLGFSDLLVKLH